MPVLRFAATIGPFSVKTVRLASPFRESLLFAQVPCFPEGESECGQKSLARDGAARPTPLLMLFASLPATVLPYTTARRQVCSPGIEPGALRITQQPCGRSFSNRQFAVLLVLPIRTRRMVGGFSHAWDSAIDLYTHFLAGGTKCCPC